MRIVQEIGIQRAAVQSAEGDGVAVDLRAEGAEAHEVDGGLKDHHLLDFRVAGQTETNLLVAAQDVPLEAGAAAVTGSAFAGEFGLAAAIPADKHAVVILGVLVKKPGVDEGANDLGGNAPLAEIGKDPPLVRVCGRQDEGRFLPGRRRLGAGDRLVTVRGVPGPAMVGQQVIHRLRETHPAERLEEGDGVAALPGGVAFPSGGVPDADAVHLRRGVVAADPLQGVAQRGQQAQQIRVLGDVQFRFREAIGQVFTQNGSPPSG